jgi:hypothetical protein
MRVVNQESDAIDYRLHILGIRVWKDTAQLIAKYGEEWTTIGFAENYRCISQSRPRSWKLQVTILSASQLTNTTRNALVLISAKCSPKKRHARQRRN